MNFRVDIKKKKKKSYERNNFVISFNYKDIFIIFSYGHYDYRYYLPFLLSFFFIIIELHRNQFLNPALQMPYIREAYLSRDNTRTGIAIDSRFYYQYVAAAIADIFIVVACCRRPGRYLCSWTVRDAGSSLVMFYMTV